MISITKKIIQSSAQPLGYYVSLPSHIEDVFGNYCENLEKKDKLSLISLLSGGLLAIENGESLPDVLEEIYASTDVELPDNVQDIVLDELWKLEIKIPGTLEALLEALVMHLRYTEFN